MTKYEIRTPQIRRGGTKEIPKHEARSRGDLCADFGSIGHSCSLRPAAAGLRKCTHRDFPFRRTTS